MVPESAPPVTPGSSIGDMNPPAAPLEAASAARVYLTKPFTGSTMGSPVVGGWASDVIKHQSCHIIFRCESASLDEEMTAV